MNSNSLILSHPLDHNTPAYGGSTGMKIKQVSAICEGCSTNAYSISFPSNHIGTHIDLPKHFIEDGFDSNSFINNVENFSYKKIELLDYTCKASELIPESYFHELDKDCDFLIIKTHFENTRSAEDYWKVNPSISLEAAKYLSQNFTKLKTIGLDVISLNSYSHREIGREAHKVLLGRKNPILILEDMKLSQLHKKPKSLDVIPTLINSVDALPVTVIAHY